MPNPSRFAALLLLLAVVPAGAAMRIDVHPPNPDAGTRVRIAVHGTWPDACVPALRAARVEGQDIVLQSEVAAQGCGGEARSYRLATDGLPDTSLQLRRNAVYRIRHEVRRGGQANTELHGFRLLHVGNRAAADLVPETGYWWPERGGEFDRAGPGLGAQLEVQSDTLSLTSFGYDARGEASWQFGAAPLQGRTAQVELSRLGDGAGPFEAYRAPTRAEPSGTVYVEILSPSRATLWFSRPRGASGEIELAPVSMVRFRFAPDPAHAWLGRWVVLAENDDGYPTLRIDFVDLQRLPEGFALLDADARHRLECRLAPRQPNSPPLACTLTLPGSPRASVDFQDVALNELRGWSGAGSRIVALKLNR